MRIKPRDDHWFKLFAFLRACHDADLDIHDAVSMLRIAFPRITIAFGIVSKHYE